MTQSRRPAALIAVLAAVCVSPPAWPQVAMQVSVEDIWIHQVPGPPQGDFWDPIIGNLFSVFGNPASIYPDVVACGTPAGGAEACTSLCPDVQGEGCRTPLKLRLSRSDSRLRLRLWEMDSNQRRPIVTDIVPDPGQCNHTSPCTFETPKGPLVVSFGTVVTGTSGTVTPSAPTTNLKRARVFSECTAAKTAAGKPPCGPFATEEEARWAALDLANLGSRCSNKFSSGIEYAGYIVAYPGTINGAQTKEVFSFLGPYPEEPVVSRFLVAHPELLALSGMKQGVRQVATYHSHPPYIPAKPKPEPGNGRFSISDLKTHTEVMLNAYVVGPAGDMRKFTPNGVPFPWWCNRFVVPAVCEKYYDETELVQGKIEHLGDLGINPPASCP